MPCNKVPGSPKAVGYWGRSPWERIEQEETPGKIKALLQDKLIARGQAVCLWLPVTSGIECTCRKNTNQANDRPCPECYGTGFVPGYLRFLYETVFFTASQIAASSFTLLPQQLAPGIITGTTTVPTPQISTPLAAQVLTAPAFDSTTQVSGPGITNVGTLLAPSLAALSSVPTPTLTTSVAALNNVQLDFQFKPNYLTLSSGALTGFLQTGAIPYSNPNGDPWEAQAEQYVRQTGNTVTTEYSFDGGTTFYPLANISGANPPPAGDGTLIFRATLTRTSVTDRAPFWSAVRARHVSSQNYNAAQITALRDEVVAGQILVLRPWIVEQAQSDTGRGVLVEWMGDRSWTMPLDFFDLSVTVDTPAARIPDREPGPHPFYQYETGIKSGNRVVLTSLKYNEEFGTATHQSFDERRAQDQEPPYADVF